jgi:hypothetical protein
VRPVTLLPVWGLVHQPVRALARQASPRLVVAVAAVEQSACRSPVAPVVLEVLEVPVALACLSVRDHPVVAAAVGRRPVVPVAPLVQLPPLAVPVAQAAVVAVRICCSCHGSRVARRLAPGWLTVAG